MGRPPTPKKPINLFLVLLAGIFIICLGICGSCIPWHGLSLKEEPFHAPASTGNWPAMQKLLDGGLSVDAEDGNGETALWLAVTHNKLDFAQKLLDHGANIHHVNHRNQEIGEMISRVSTNPKTLKWVEDKLGKPLP